MTGTNHHRQPWAIRAVRAPIGALGRWLDRVLPTAPEPGAEPSRSTKLMIWQLRNRLPVSQGRPRGGPGGFR